MELYKRKEKTHTRDQAEAAAASYKPFLSPKAILLIASTFPLTKEPGNGFAAEISHDFR